MIFRHEKFENLINVHLIIVLDICFSGIAKSRSGKQKNAAMETAAKGDRTLVDTKVAMEFAESWNPVIKSKIRTSTAIIYKTVIFCLFVFELLDNLLNKLIHNDFNICYCRVLILLSGAQNYKNIITFMN